ncbi:MAG TPA: nuclear transport factor 2 family protein [Pyrinomonadaceae bacterium]|nr:nuclear transport factor 2 family protein [Pyrinomonadaceae bacterium]
MNHVLNIALVALLSSIHIGSFPPRQASSGESEVLQTVAAFDKAWDRKDAGTIERILSDNYVYFTSEGNVWTRDNLIKLLRSPEYILDFAERTELQVHLTNSTAVVSSRWKGNGKYEGKEFRDDQRCSLVLARQGKNWKLLSEHCTQIAHRGGTNSQQD